MEFKDLTIHQRNGIIAVLTAICLSLFFTTVVMILIIDKNNKIAKSRLKEIVHANNMATEYKEQLNVALRAKVQLIERNNDLRDEAVNDKVKLQKYQVEIELNNIKHDREMRQQKDTIIKNIKSKINEALDGMDDDLVGSKFNVNRGLYLESSNIKHPNVGIAFSSSAYPSTTGVDLSGGIGFREPGGSVVGYPRSSYTTCYKTPGWNLSIGGQ